MPDDRDYSANPPRRDRSRESFDSARDRDDYDGPSTRREVPRLVRTAGIIWIIFGCLILLNAAVNLLFLGASGSGANLAGGSCGAIIGLLFAIAFLFVGVQSVKGTATDTLGNGIGSIVIGVLNAGLGALAVIGGLAMYAAMSQGAVPPGANQAALLVTFGGGISLLSGMGLILAGVLALMGRADYKIYRRAGKRSAPIDD